MSRRRKLLPAIRGACDASISGHAATLEPDIAEAMARYHVRGGCTAQSLALHTQAVLQGAYVLAKAKGNAGIAADSIDHLRRYVVQLFGADRAAANKTGSTKEHRR